MKDPSNLNEPQRPQLTANQQVCSEITLHTSKQWPSVIVIQKEKLEDCHDAI